MKKTKRKTLRAIMALLIASIIAVCLPAAAAPQGATITSLAGTVKVIKAPGQKRIPAVVGMTLDENAEIMTGPNSSAVLSAGGGVIKIKALTSITISSLTSSGANTTTALSVKKGSVLAKVDKMSKGSTFNVKTPTAVAGVRGTQFSVDVAPKSDGPGATLKSVKGRVEIKKAKTSAWIAAKNGDKMTKGDTIRSGPDGNCVFAWGKGNVVVIKPVTQITVSELASGTPGAGGKNELTLATGRAIVNSKKAEGSSSSFNIRTPTAVAGVRGTKFEVAVKGGDPTKDANVTAKLVDVKGTVEVRQKGTSDWKKATNNSSVSIGDTVRTKADSSCVITWGKGNVVRISDLAQVRVDKMNTSPATGSDDSELFVASGKVFVKAKKIKGTASTFTVKTPTAVAGVRGTEFSVKSSGGNRENAGADTNNGGGQGKGNASDSESKAGDQGKGESKAYGQGGGGGTTTTTDNKPGGDSENKGGGEREGGNRENAGADTNNAGGQGTGNASDSESKAGEQGSGESKAFGQGDATGGGEQPAGKTEILCAEGEVAVMSEAGDETSVSQGEKMDIAEGGDMSEPEPASQEEAAAFKAEGGLDNPDFVSAGGEGYPQEKPGETEIMCSEGGVEVSTPDGANSIDVGAGEKTAIAEEAQPAAPAAMTNEEHTEIKSEKELDNPENLNTASTGEGDAPTTVKVLDGELAIESIDGSMIELGAGMKTDVVEGQAPQQPEPMSAEEIKTFQQEAAAIEQADTGGGAQGKTETTTKTETATTKTEPTKTEPTKTEPTKTEPTKTEPGKTESTTTTTKTETTGAGDTTTTKTETTGAGDTTTTKTETAGAGDTSTTKTETTTTGAGDTTMTGTGDSSTTTTTDTTDTTTTDTTATDTATDITDTAGTDAVMDTIVDQTTDSVVDTINVQNPASDIANELSNCTSGSCMQVHIEF